MKFFKDWLVDSNSNNVVSEGIQWPLISYKILYEEGASLHVSEIVTLAHQRGLISDSVDIKKEVEVLTKILRFLTKNRNKKSPFRRHDRNVYSLRSLKDGYEILSGLKPLLIPDTQETEAKVRESKEPFLTLIKAIGMYWERSLIEWKAEPDLFGIANHSEKAINFNSQRGIYILYDGKAPVYVGRVIDRSMGRRLYEHTYDRLAGRWNRFSWFGLLDIGSGGELINEVPESISTELLISTFESLLIEAMEPPQNRRRGDDFSEIEFIQVQDQKVKTHEQN